ncbi:MAG TPA: ABC transporter ATP-binding protein [Xanthobacteraceae bacterium]|nr:ABC transporter ATP-binding protein [Xanthobacteraceae bacterium]
MSGGIAVQSLTLTLGGFRLDKLDFAVAGHEIVVILGPNGAGKSVTLETIAGFHRPDGGRVLIGGRDVTALPPERRNIGFVVQQFGLFPHLNVERNVAIARRKHRSPAARTAALPPADDAAALLAYFGVARLARRMPEDLSPGEKQRVALARAVAAAPDLFLFDEPFSALDTQTRVELRDELLSYLRALAIPAIFVTHDYTDALTLADRIVVLRDGAAVQIGPAAEIFHRPANAFVARFVGVENVIDASVVTASGAMATLAVGDQLLRAALPPHWQGAPQRVRLGIRAEQVVVAPPAEAAPSPAVNRLTGRVTGLRTLGPLVRIEIDCGFALQAYLLGPQALNLAAGSAVTAAIAVDAIAVMPD